jgi:dipeptidyl aminopeptidase/acylaminoacyl peptidase
LYWTADGRIVFSSEADGWVHLYALDLLHPGLPLALTPGKYEVEDATVSGDGRAMVYAANDTMADPLHPEPLDADRRHLWGLDLTQDRPAPVFLTRGAGNEVHPALNASGAVLAALVSDARTPMMPALIDADGKRYPLRAVAGNAAMVTPQQVLMTAKDGMRVHGQLFVAEQDAGSSASLRNGKNKKAALIFVHGGPRREMLLGYAAMEYYSNAYAMNQYLAAQGFVVLSVNYRCGIGYGINFRQCEHGGADGATEYNDVLAAVAYLRGRGDVDPKRIGIWGGSYGGYLTAMALARNSDLFAAGVDFHGVHEWALEDNALTDWLHGPGWNPTIPATLAAKAHASSPMGDLSRWKSPVLLIHGDDDANVSYAQTPLLADALRARGVHVEELIFPDEIHEFLLHKDWLAAYEAEAAFFVRMLGRQ